MDITSFLIGYKKGQAGGSSGGGDISDAFDGVYWKQEPYLPKTLSGYVYNAAVLNDELYAFFKNSTTNKTEVWKLQDSEWVYVCDLPSTVSYITGTALIEYNGLLHAFVGESKKHITFDGTTWTTLAELPESYNAGTRGAFVLNDVLYAVLGGVTTPNLYKYTGVAWELVIAVGTSNDRPSAGVAVVGNVAYWFNSVTGLYSFDGATLTLLRAKEDVSSYLYAIVVSDGKNLYFPQKGAIPNFQKLIGNFAENDVVDAQRRLPFNQVYIQQIIVFKNRLHILGASSGAPYVHLSCAFE